MRDLSKAACVDATDEEPCTSDLLARYSSVCTTCIVGIALEESKRGSCDEQSEFDKFDLLDPDFMVEGVTDFHVHPEEILMHLCGGFIEDIVRVMGDMESSWTRRCTSVKETDYVKAKALWEFAYERASVYVDREYGPQVAEDFCRLGDTLFL